MVRKNTILLVDDDPVVRDIIKVALEGRYEVLTASNYSEAITYLGDRIDLALIDYVLPDGDGLDLLKAIRAVRPELSVIIMTGYSTEAVIIKALRAGATDYIKKPVSIKYLSEKISGIFECKGVNGQPENVGSREEFIIDGIADYIAERYRDDLTLDQLAEKACMNKYKFCKVFKRRIGQSLTSYLNYVRVNNSAELIQNPDLSITEIAFYIGYKSIVHFERMFKSQYGMSPREFRKNLKK